MPSFPLIVNGCVHLRSAGAPIVMPTLYPYHLPSRLETFLEIQRSPTWPVQLHERKGRHQGQHYSCCSQMLRSLSFGLHDSSFPRPVFIPLRTHQRSIAGRPDRRREAMAIARLLTSVYGTTTTPSWPLKDWSSSSPVPRNSVMMAGQIVDRTPRTRTNVIAANGSWTS